MAESAAESRKTPLHVPSGRNQLSLQHFRGTNGRNNGRWQLAKEGIQL